MSSIGLLRDRRALLTGATGGLGGVLAAALLEAGASVALTGRDRRRVDALATELRAGAGGQRCLPIVLDVTDEAACQSAVVQVEQAWGGVDLLVNNAGVATSAPFLETDSRSWEQALQVNAGGPFRLSQAVLPGMVERRFGRVIQIASTAALTGQRYVAAYTASKHAVLGLTRALAVEYAASGVTFNCVCPHFIAGSLTERTVATIAERSGRPAAAVLERLQTPQGRLVEPQEVAAACVYLASDAAGAVNGQALVLDGGWRAA